MSVVLGTLLYSLAVTAPSGWKEVPAIICKRAYGADLDGQIFSKDGARHIVRAHCFIKIARTGDIGSRLPARLSDRGHT